MKSESIECGKYMRYCIKLPIKIKLDFQAKESMGVYPFSRVTSSWTSVGCQLIHSKRKKKQNKKRKKYKFRMAPYSMTLSIIQQRKLHNKRSNYHSQLWHSCLTLCFSEYFIGDINLSNVGKRFRILCAVLMASRVGANCEMSSFATIWVSLSQIQYLK